MRINHWPTRQQHFTQLIIDQPHCHMLHGGVSITLTKFCEHFWIFRGRQSIKKVIRHSIFYREFRLKPASAPVAPLPSDRVPLQSSGHWLQSPLYVHIEGTTPKRHVILFICTASRAIHLELISDMSTEALLLAFRRFGARRSLSCVVYLNNAQPFKRGTKDLCSPYDALNLSDIQKYCTNYKISWKFIAERAAWCEGFGEKMMHSVCEGMALVDPGKVSFRLRPTEHHPYSDAGWN